MIIIPQLSHYAVIVNMNIIHEWKLFEDNVGMFLLYTRDLYF